MDHSFAHLRKAQRRMEGVGGGIGRVGIDLAHHDCVARSRSLLEQMLVQFARQSLSARRARNHHAVDIDEARQALAEPQEIRAIVGGVLIESDQQRIIDDMASQEGRSDEGGKTLRRQQRKLCRMGVVERQQRRWRRFPKQESICRFCRRG